MNNLQVLGRERPEGTGRIIWNLFMVLALGIMGTAAIYVAGINRGAHPLWQNRTSWFRNSYANWAFSLRNRKLSKNWKVLK